MNKKKLIVIKVGAKDLVNKDNRVSGAILYELVRQITALYEQNILTLLVSSGAGMAGKEVLHKVTIPQEGIRQQVYCSVGQPRLMRLYYNTFHHFGMHCAQVLATKGDFFNDNTNRDNLLNCYNGLLNEGIIPITNENDATSLKTMFSDNDELAVWVAELLKADQLFYFSQIYGKSMANGLLVENL